MGAFQRLQLFLGGGEEGVEFGPHFRRRAAAGQLDIEGQQTGPVVVVRAAENRLQAVFDFGEILQGVGRQGAAIGPALLRGVFVQGAVEDLDGRLEMAVVGGQIGFQRQKLGGVKALLGGAVQQVAQLGRLVLG